MNLSFVPISIAVCGSTEGLLVFMAGRLVAVLVLLGNLHEDNAGKWFLEVAFHEKITNKGRIFDSMAEAETWIGNCLASPDDRTGCGARDSK